MNNENNISEIDETDLKILEFFQEDGRLSQRKISKNIGVSVGTIHNRVEKMKKRGIIKGFQVELDYFKLGYNIKVMIKINSKKDIDHLIYMNKKNIIASYYLTGKYNVILVAKFKNKDDLYSFLTILSKEEYINEITMEMILKENKISSTGELRELKLDNILII